MLSVGIYSLNTMSAELGNGTGQPASTDHTGAIPIMNEPSDNLTNLLKKWQPAPLQAGHIRAGVWSRIEREQANPLADVWARIASWFERPVIAGGVLAVALVIGIAFGATASAQAKTEAYLQSMVAFRH